MSQLAEPLARFTADFLESASNHVYTSGWQDAGGIMPFADAMGVFRLILGELNDAEAQGLTSEMPRNLQKTLSEQLANLHSYLTNTVGGSNQVQSFTDEVDRLHQNIWNGGFRYRGKKVVGYEAKYADIKRLVVEAEQAREKAAAIEALQSQLTGLLESATQQNTKIESLAVEIEEILGETQSNCTVAESDLKRLADHLTSIANSAAEAEQGVSSVEALVQSASTHEKRIAQFVVRVEENEKRLNDAVSAATKGLKDLGDEATVFKDRVKGEVDAMIERLKGVEKDINEKLSKATGYTLFHSFDARQKAITGHWIWLFLSVAALVGALLFASSVLTGVTDFTVATFVKVGITIPTAVLVGFALQQYSRERRLKEEYAFKSAISLSLEPYRKLVEEAIEQLSTDDRHQLADFLVKSIATIFETPTDKVFGVPKTRGPSDTKIISGFLEEAQKIKELIKPP